MTAALVGPLRRVWFNADWHPRFYDLPKSTLDLRYTACADHHPACDCREASLAESWAELKAEMDSMYNAILAAIKGHQTYAGIDGYPDEFGTCKCPACDIARAARVGYFECKRQREEADERARERARARHARSYYPYTDEVPF